MANLDIRAEIDSHRKKLVLFDKVYERLNKDSEKERRMKHQLIETSNEAFMQSKGGDHKQNH